MYSVLRTKFDGISKFTVVFIQQSGLVTTCSRRSAQYGLLSLFQSQLNAAAGCWPKNRKGRNFTRFGRPSEKAPKISPQQVYYIVTNYQNACNI